MSAEATGHVWRNSPYTGSQLLVHLAIADVVNDMNDYDFWMSMGALAKKARVGRSTAAEAVRHMVEKGYLSVVIAGKEKRQPTRYHFHFLSTGSATSPDSGRALVRDLDTELNNTTKETKALVQDLDEHVDCVRCKGRGVIWNGEGGFEIPCPSATIDA